VFVSVKNVSVSWPSRYYNLLHFKAWNLIVHSWHIFNSKISLFSHTTLVIRPSKLCKTIKNKAFFLAEKTCRFIVPIILKAAIKVFQHQFCSGKLHQNIAINQTFLQRENTRFQYTQTHLHKQTATRTAHFYTTTASLINTDT